MTQAHANLNQMKVNLDHTVIHAPIDGIVIPQRGRGSDRRGQHAGADMYLLAADLTKMKVNANIDEADVGASVPGRRSVSVSMPSLPTTSSAPSRRSGCSPRSCRTS